MLRRTQPGLRSAGLVNCGDQILRTADRPPRSVWLKPLRAKCRWRSWPFRRGDVLVRLESYQGAVGAGDKEGAMGGGLGRAAGSCGWSAICHAGSPPASTPAAGAVRHKAARRPERGGRPGGRDGEAPWAACCSSTAFLQDATLAARSAASLLDVA